VAYPEERESEPQHQKSLRNSTRWKLSKYWRIDMRTSIQTKGTTKAEEMDPGRWWVPEEVGYCLQMDYLLCRSSTAQGTYL
jgi:hypothetical protein